MISARAAPDVPGRSPPWAPQGSFAVSVAVAGLIAEPLRTLLSIVSVGAAIALILVFEGFQAGLDHQLASVPSHLPADLVAAQPGTLNFIGARSVLPQNVRSELEAVPGVERVHPLVSVPVVYSRGDRRTPITVIGYDTAGGPHSLLAGHAVAAPRELVIDTALAHKYGLELKEAVEVLGEEWTIAGISLDTATMLTPFVYARYDDLVDLYAGGDFAEDFAEEPPLLSFLLIETSPGFDVAQVRSAIEKAVDRVDVLSPAELARNDVALGRRLMGPILRLMIGIAWVAGMLVVAMTMYATVDNRRRELGVMKAIGAPNRRLFAALAVETFVVTALAFGIAIALSELISTAIASASPEYLVLPSDPSIVGRTALMAIAIAGAGAFTPMFTVARLDPALVFRS